MAETIQRTTIQPAARTQAGSANQWRTILRIALYVVVALGAAASMLPFVWTFLSSGKSVNEL